MSVRADMKYDATVKDAYITETEKGTSGLFMAYETDDGPITHTWWVTLATVDRVRENLQECFGLTDKQLSNDDFLEKIGENLRGQTCRITTIEDTYNDKTRVIVQWMNPAGFRAKKAPTATLGKVAGLFSGKVAPAVKWDGGAPLDDDVPFGRYEYPI